MDNKMRETVNKDVIGIVFRLYCKFIAKAIIILSIPNLLSIILANLLWNNYIKENRNVIKYNSKYDLYAYLSEKESDPNLIKEENLIIKDFEYFESMANQFDKEIIKIKTIKITGKKEDQFVYERKLIPFKYRPIKDRYKTVSKNYTKKYDRIFLHVYIVKSDHEINSNISELNIILHRIKTIDAENWSSNYTINLIDHREDLNKIEGTIFSKLLDYNLINGTYTPALSIEYNNDNNNNNSTQLLLNLKFNQINFCQFIVHSCEESSKNEQLRQICHEESFKLSTNLFYLIQFEIIDSKHRSISLLYISFTILIPVFELEFLVNYFHLTNLKGFSTNLIKFELSKSIIYLLYDLKRFPNVICEFNDSYDYFNRLLLGNLIIIFFWLTIVFINLYKLKTYFKYKKFHDKQTEKYDNLAFKYLSIVMIPLFLFYSYYSFNNYYHQNYYHLIINTLYGYLLNFGFMLMLSQYYINFKFGTIYFSYEAYFTLILIPKFVLFAIEDLFDYQFKYREPFKLFYLKDFLLIFILFIQMRYYKAKNKSIENCQDKII